RHHGHLAQALPRRGVPTVPGLPEGLAAEGGGSAAPAGEASAEAEPLQPHGAQGTGGGTEIDDVRTLAEADDPPRCAAPACPGQVIGSAVRRRCRRFPRRGLCPPLAYLTLRPCTHRRSGPTPPHLTGHPPPGPAPAPPCLDRPRCPAHRPVPATGPHHTARLLPSSARWATSADRARMILAAVVSTSRPTCSRISSRELCCRISSGTHSSTTPMRESASRRSERICEPPPPISTPSSSTPTRLCSAARPMMLSGTGRTHLGATIVAEIPCPARRSATASARPAKGPTESMSTAAADSADTPRSTSTPASSRL